MQISKEEYERLNRHVEELKNSNDMLTEDNAAAFTVIKKFDEILKKIVRASNGHQLIQTQENLYAAQNIGGFGGDSYHRCNPPSNEELLREDNRQLVERVCVMEARLAAVEAIATFAQEHKA